MEQLKATKHLVPYRKALVSDCLVPVSQGCGTIFIIHLALLKQHHTLIHSEDVVNFHVGPKYILPEMI